MICLVGTHVHIFPYIYISIYIYMSIKNSVTCCKFLQQRSTSRDQTVLQIKKVVSECLSYQKRTIDNKGGFDVARVILSNKMLE